MEAGASCIKGTERNKPLEVREGELDIGKVSEMEVDVDCMCYVWIG